MSAENLEHVGRFILNNKSRRFHILVGVLPLCDEHVLGFGLLGLVVFPIGIAFFLIDALDKAFVLFQRFEHLHILGDQIIHFLQLSIKCINFRDKPLLSFEFSLNSSLSLLSLSFDSFNKFMHELNIILKV